MSVLHVILNGKHVRVVCDSVHSTGTDTGIIEAHDAAGRRVASFKADQVSSWWTQDDPCEETPCDSGN